MQYFTNQIIQRYINGSLCRRVQANEMIEIAHNVFNKKRVITQVTSKGRDTGQHRLQVFSIVFVGSGLAVARVFPVVNLDYSVRGDLLHAPRNTERHSQFEIDGFGVNLHSSSSVCSSPAFQEVSNLAIRCHFITNAVRVNLLKE